MDAPKRETYNWPWILGTLIVGLALIGLAHFGDLLWSWPSITTGSITNVGAAFVIAFLLFVAERRFTQNITRTVEATAEATAGLAARRVVEEQTTGLSARVASLEDELAERRAATQQRQDESVGALASELTAETVWDALDEMVKVGAVNEGLVVSGSRSSPYPLVRFRIRSHMANSRYMDSEENLIRQLAVSAVAEPVIGEFGVPYFGRDWVANESFADVVEEIDASMRRAGRMKDAKLLDPVAAAAEFSRAMTVVKADQQAPLGEEKVHGVLLELHADDWAITTEGLQKLSGDFFVAWGSLGVEATWASRTRPLPPSPEGVPAKSWPFLYSRLGQHVSQPGSAPFGF